MRVEPVVAVLLLPVEPSLTKTHPKINTGILRGGGKRGSNRRRLKRSGRRCKLGIGSAGGRPSVLYLPLPLATNTVGQLRDLVDQDVQLVVHLSDLRREGCEFRVYCLRIHQQFLLHVHKNRADVGFRKELLGMLSDLVRLQLQIQRLQEGVK